MKVLMTGDKGYIGTVMKSCLRRCGHDVTGLDTNYFETCTIPGYDEDDETEPHINADIRDIDKIIKNFDAIIHLAGLSNDVLGDLDPQTTYAVNFQATIKLAELAKQAGIPRFIFASSCSVYGSNQDIVKESSPVNPQTLYAELKYKSEISLSSMSCDNFSPTILRNATVYGMSRRMRNDLIVNMMTAQAHTDGKVQIYGDGFLWRPLVHVVDVAKAFLMVLESERDKVHNQIINVGFTQENYTVKQVASLVGDVVNDTSIEYVPSSDKRNYHVNFDKLKKMFPNFSPHKSIASEIKSMWETYKDVEASREVNFTHSDLLGDRYNRLKHLKSLMTEDKIDKELRWL